MLKIYLLINDFFIMIKLRLVTFLSVFCIFFSIEGYSQNTNSNYFLGNINVAGQSLPISLTIEENKDTTIILMGSPQQTKQLFPVTKQRLEKDSIVFSIKPMGVVFRGKYNESKDTIVANFRQGIVSTTLILSKQENEYISLRPQTPNKPYPYIEEEVSFKVEGVNYTFNGTLTLPKKEGKFPCVILISGSGMQDRNEEIMNHEPFLVIADYLTRNGIAVFRYDDRGYGEDYPDSTIYNATTMDFSLDAYKAFQTIKNHPNIDTTRIGLLGHSEGGLVASILASQHKDIKFVVLFAAPGENGLNVLLEQNKRMLTQMNIPNYGIDFQLSMLKKAGKLIKKNVSDNEFENKMNAYFDKELNKIEKSKWKNIPNSSYSQRGILINQLKSRWMRTFFFTDPYNYIKKIKQPVLALNGTKDVQVDAKYNLPRIEKALKKAKNKNYEIVYADGLNHLFQECKTGAIDEYANIEQTISPKILEKISNFILSLK